MLQKFAEDLKNLRESKNITLTEVANQTKISQSTFAKIENGDFTFQPETYVRAFLKQYALALDEEPDEIIKEYDKAKSGKYTPKTQETKQETKQEKNTEPEVKESVTKETVKEVKLEPVAEEKKQPKIEPEEKKESRKEPAKDIKIVEPSKSSPKASKEEKLAYNFSDYDKSPGIRSSTFKTIGAIVIGLAICAGLFFLGKSLFTGNKKNVEVQRQNFDEVVKENEKTILGKRSEEEIQDSIRKAQEELKKLEEATAGDTLTLVITSIRKGSVTIITDSVDINNPERVEFGGNQIGEWKGKRSFIISSPNTSTFVARLNGKKIDFPDKVADKVRLNKEGIVK